MKRYYIPKSALVMCRSKHQQFACDLKYAIDNGILSDEDWRVGVMSNWYFEECKFTNSGYGAWGHTYNWVEQYTISAHDVEITRSGRAFVRCDEQPVYIECHRSW